MSSDREQARVTMLSATYPGEDVTIVGIAPESMRALCAAVGVQVGDVVHCSAVAPRRILLTKSSGRVVPVERAWARFIAVSAGATARGPAPVG